MSSWEDALATAHLLHLLTCSNCRTLATRQKVDEVSAALDEEETKDELGRGDRDGEGAARASLLARRREAAGELLAQLIDASAVARLRLLDQAPFRSSDLLDLLLEESHTVQLIDPSRAAELARLAARLAGSLMEEASSASALARAFLLGANARRLDFRLKAAESLLTKATPYLPNRSERAYYCRTAALLRWDQGRLDEAEALLQHATCLYGAEGHDCEAGACLTLLGLVLQETGDHEDMLSHLLQGWFRMDRKRQPYLALRGGMELVAALARAERPARAQSVLHETYRLVREVTDPEEKFRAYWWEGRALASLGNFEVALQILESVRSHLIEEKSLAEAALVSLDLVLAHAAAGSVEGLGSLAGELAIAFPNSRALALAVERIGLSAGLAMQEDPELRAVVEASAVLLRRTFRASGLRIKPLLVA